MQIHLKKFLLSGFVIIVFIFYAVYERAGNKPPSPAIIPSGQNNPGPSSFSYKDGAFVGDPADAYYGNIQVKIMVAGGKITDLQFLDYPKDRNTSVFINSQAMPLLKSEAIQAQSAQVNIVSGATDTSYAFINSLKSALSKSVKMN